MVEKEEKLGSPPRLQNIPEPEVRPDEVLVKIKVSGVCHSDVHIWKGEWPSVLGERKRSGVSVGGHEGVGDVVEAGSAVTSIMPGDRVGIPWMNRACLVCEPCLSGREVWCEDAHYTGIHTSGTFAELTKVSERYATKIPEGIPDTEAAPLLCAGVTAFGGIAKLVEQNVRPGKVIAVLGAAGGLGHYGTQIATAFGYKVVGIDKGEKRLEFVRELGAAYAIDAQEAEGYIKEKFGGVSAAVCYTPSIEGYALAFSITRMAGVVVAVGEPPEQEGNLPVTPASIIDRGIRVIPNVVGSPLDLKHLLLLYKDKRVKSAVTYVAPMEELGEVLEMIDKAKITGRAVVTW
jgi:propanol-preferring alcohol dehydrogenase